MTMSRRLPPPPFELPIHPFNLVDALIDALGDLSYTPATEELFRLRGTDYDAEAIGALIKLAPDRLTKELLATAKDQQIDSYLREQALVSLRKLPATNHVRDLVPLLDDPRDHIPRTLPGGEWRICNRAAETMAILLGWESGTPRRSSGRNNVTQP